MTNYFEVLNISENAEIEVIRSSYIALVKKYHPDNTKFPKDVAEAKMVLINEAYQVLSDDNARRNYIRELHGAHSEEVNFSSGTMSDKDDFYSDIEENGLLSYIVVIVIIISIVCCVAYFGPGLLKETWYNIQESIRDVINTF